LILADKLVQLQMELLRLGEYEEAEKVSLQFNVGGVSFHQIENSVEGFPFFLSCLFYSPSFQR
jgi:hypothetical protein